MRKISVLIVIAILTVGFFGFKADKTVEMEEGERSDVRIAHSLELKKTLLDYFPIFFDEVHEVQIHEDLNKEGYSLYLVKGKKGSENTQQYFSLQDRYIYSETFPETMKMTLSDHPCWYSPTTWPYCVPVQESPLYAVCGYYLTNPPRCIPF